jgi:hypothetical protein
MARGKGSREHRQQIVALQLGKGKSARELKSDIRIWSEEPLPV